MEFNKELRVVTRYKNGSKDKVVALEIKVDTQCNRCYAVFADGSMRFLTDLTVEQYNKTDLAKKNGYPPPVFEAQHTITHNRIRVAYRADRKPMYSIFEQAQQRLQALLMILIMTCVIYLFGFKV